MCFCLVMLSPWLSHESPDRHTLFLFAVGSTPQVQKPAPPMPPAQHQPAMPPAQPQAAGPGLMGTFASSAAGSMAGSMIGNSLFGGRGGEAPQQTAPQSAPAVASSAGPACDFESKQFLQCMSNTQENFEQCTAFFDMFKQCNAQVQH
mmetsp:Transcript_24477/g.68611  ORF Transcript_24477/g.68611 Transcript_24477/m.68611 type:complete len:148 (-) Transcript_24477:723-1166(-)